MSRMHGTEIEFWQKCVLALLSAPKPAATKDGSNTMDAKMYADIMVETYVAQADRVIEAYRLRRP